MSRKGKSIVAGFLAAAGSLAVPFAAYAADAGSDTSFSEAITNTVLGVSVVFVMLILIALIIYAFRIIPVLEKKFRKTKPVVKRTAPARATAASDDLELVAAIAAAIAMSKGVSADKIQIRSITKR